MNIDQKSPDFILGKLAALELLLTTLVALSRPDIADKYLGRVIALREQAARDGRLLSTYEVGYASVSDTLHNALSVASQAEKIASLHPPKNPTQGN